MPDIPTSIVPPWEGRLLVWVGGLLLFYVYNLPDYNSYGNEEMIEELRGLMHDAPDNKTREEFQRFIDRIEGM